MQCTSRWAGPGPESVAASLVHALDPNDHSIFTVKGRRDAALRKSVPRGRCPLRSILDLRETFPHIQSALFSWIFCGGHVAIPTWTQPRSFRTPQSSSRDAAFRNPNEAPAAETLCADPSRFRCLRRGQSGSARRQC